MCNKNIQPNSVLIQFLMYSHNNSSSKCITKYPLISQLFILSHHVCKDTNSVSLKYNITWQHNAVGKVASLSLSLLQAAEGKRGSHSTISDFDWKQMLAQARTGENLSENSQGSGSSFWALAWVANHCAALADLGGEVSLLIGLRFKRGRQEQMSWESFGIQADPQ